MFAWEGTEVRDETLVWFITNVFKTWWEERLLLLLLGWKFSKKTQKTQINFEENQEKFTHS